MLFPLKYSLHEDMVSGVQIVNYAWANYCAPQAIQHQLVSVQLFLRFSFQSGGGGPFIEIVYNEHIINFN